VSQYDCLANLLNIYQNIQKKKYQDNIALYHANKKYTKVEIMPHKLANWCYWGGIESWPLAHFHFACVGLWS
jgi:hypothetical protein